MKQLLQMVHSYRLKIVQMLQLKLTQNLLSRRYHYQSPRTRR